MIYIYPMVTRVAGSGRTMTRSAATQIGSARRCRGLISRVAYARVKQMGVDASGLLQHAGLTVTEIEAQEAWLSVAGQIRFVDLVANAIGDPDLGFHLAKDFDLRQLEFLYYIASSADTLGNALLRLERYSVLVNEGVLLHVKKGKSVRVGFRYVGVSRHTDRHQIEFWITAAIRLCQHLTNRDLKPMHVGVVHNRSFGKNDLERFAGVTIKTGADIDEVEFPAGSWDLPIVTKDHYLHDVLVRYCEEALAHREVKASPLRARVENTASELLPHGMAQSNIVATRLGMSPRTMARRLSAEGLSFAGILRDLRLALAHRYLADRNLPISQIAWLLGYTEIGAFTHAFRRWTGSAPSAVRGQSAGARGT
jgi:AraC-like DNA-binding protein